MVRLNGDADDKAQLRKDVAELRHVARSNIFRAAVIKQTGDVEVAALLVSEAAVMLMVCSGVEHLLDG